MRPHSPLDARRKPPHALIVGRETLGRLAALVLRHCGCESELATSLRHARTLLQKRPPAVLIVEAGLEHGIGSGLLHQPPTGPQAPALIALVQLEDGMSSLTSFEGGADQVVRVPFTPDELAVRTGALLRRLGHPVTLASTERVENLELSLDEKVIVGKNLVALTPSENSLLYLLAANAGRNVSLRDLREMVWGISPGTSDGAIERRVAGLRQRLAGLDAGGLAIQRVEGGFALN